MVLEYFTFRKSKKDGGADHDDASKTDETAEHQDASQKGEGAPEQQNVDQKEDVVQQQVAEQHEEATDKNLVLNREDEQFLERITSVDEAPPLPEQPTVILENGKKVRGKDAQIALMDGADQIPLPSTPGPEDEDQHTDKEDEPVSEEEKKRRDYWSYIPAMPSWKGKNKARPGKDARAGESSEPKADQSAEDKAAREEELANQKSEEKQEERDHRAKEHEDLTSILSRLNLSAVNNRVFSFSKESQELLEKFTLVLKDIVNGVPTAYDDLEHLLTHSEPQLRRMFDNMPPFLRTLVMSLPSKMTGSIGPELFAAAAERPGAKLADVASGSGKEGDKKKKGKEGRGAPALKKLVSEKGAVATMLRSILNFLKLRFPAFVSGTNVLMSLAVFLLLFVFWYCHKRGKEVRLSKEQQDALAAKESASASDSDASPEMEDTIVLDEPGSGADRPGPSDAAAQSEAEAEAALPMGSKEEPVEAAAADKGLQQES